MIKLIFDYVKKINTAIERDNRGSSIIIVIVAMSFTMILASVVLSSAFMNIKVRSMDKRSKTDFYYAEKAVDEIYTHIGEDCAQAMGKAYREVILNSNGNVGTPTLNQKKKFKEKYKSNVCDIGYSTDVLKLYTTVVPEENKIFKVEIESFNAIDIDGNVVSDPKNKLNDIKKFKLKGLRVEYGDKDKKDEDKIDGYVSVITTDIIIDVPNAYIPTIKDSKYIDFTDPGDPDDPDEPEDPNEPENIESNPLDYAIIANKGIDFKGDNIKIYGDVYGGPLENSVAAYKVENSATVEMKGNYIISRGDIDLGTEAILEFSSDAINNPHVWFENLKLNGDSSKLEADSKTSFHALGDLEINGEKCSANLGGAYYGYNNEALVDSETDKSPEYITKEFEGLKNAHDDLVIDNVKHAFSSSIIVNGNNTTVDVDNLQTLLLMGRAYVDFAPDKPVDYKYPTGEGFALKTNQDVYLVPQEFIADGYTNPCAGTVGFDFNDHVDFDSEWFAIKKGYLNDVKVKTIKVGDLYYAYLNLKKPGEYFEDVVSSQSYNKDDTVHPTAYELNKIMQASTSNGIFNFDELKFNSGANIYIHNGGTGDNEVRSGASQYDVGSKSISKANNLGKFVVLPSTYYARYRDLCVNLADRGTGVENNEWINPDYPAGKHIKFNGDSLVSSDYDDTDDTFKIDGNIYGKVEVKNNSQVISGDNTVPCFYIVDGDITIESGTKIRGLIAATGKVTVKENAKIRGMIISKDSVILAGKNIEIVSDNSFLQYRVDKELNTIRDAIAKGKDKSEVYKSDYVISYLVNPEDQTKRLYDDLIDKMEKNPDIDSAEPDDGEDTDEDDGSDPSDEESPEGADADVVDSDEGLKAPNDYRQYVTFENWHKGEE